MKEETIEEAAERLFNNFQKENPIISKKDIRPFKLGFIKGAKWQAERMYSEEDMLRFAQKYSVNKLDKSHIQQYKKK
jgi:hypothetical protein